MSLSSICADIENLLQKRTPNYLPEITYKLAPKGYPIESQQDAAELTERSFQVRAGNVSSIGSFNCTYYNPKIELIIIWRYFLSMFSDDNYMQTNLMSCCDASNTIQLVTQPPITYTDCLNGIIWVSDSELQQSDEDERIYYRQLTFEVELNHIDSEQASDAAAPKYSTYDEVAAYLTTKTSTFKASVPLYKIGFEGNSSYVLGNFAWQSGLNGFQIAPVGALDFTKVTDGGFGQIQSIVSATSVILKAGHSFPSALEFKARVIKISDATELYDNIVASCSGNTLTIPDTTGCSENDLIYALNKSEFTIGNSSRNIELTAECSLNFTGAGLKLKGEALLNFIPVFDARTSLKAGILSGYLVPDDNDYVMVGWKKDAEHIFGGVSKLPANHLEYGSRRYNSANGVSNAVNNSGAPNMVRELLCLVTAYSLTGGGTNSRIMFHCNCDKVMASVVYSAIGLAVINLILGAKASIIANKGAEYSSVQVF